MEGEQAQDDSLGANAEFLQNLQSAVNSTGVGGRVEVIQTENGPLAVIFMDEGADTNAALNFTGETQYIVEDDGSTQYEIVESEVVTESIPGNDQINVEVTDNAVAGEVVEEVVTSDILPGYAESGPCVDVVPEFTALPLNVGQQTYHTLVEEQICEPYDTGQLQEIELPHSDTGVTVDTNQYGDVASADIAQTIVGAETDKLVATPLHHYNAPVSPKIIKIAKPTYKQAAVSNTVVSNTQGSNVSEQFLSNYSTKNITIINSSEGIVKNQFSAPERNFTSSLIGPTNVSLSEEIQAVKSIVDNEPTVSIQSGINMDSSSVLYKPQSVLVTNKKPFSSLVRKVLPATASRLPQTKSTPTQVQIQNSEIVQTVKSLNQPLKFTQSAAMSLQKPHLASKKPVMQSSAGTQTQISPVHMQANRVQVPAQIQRKQTSQHLSSIGKDRGQKQSGLTKQYVTVQRKTDGALGREATKAGKPDLGSTITYIDSHGHVMSKSVLGTVVSDDPVAVPVNSQPVPATSMRFKRVGTKLVYADSHVTRPVVKTGPSVATVSTQNQIIKTTPSVSDPVRTQLEIFTPEKLKPLVFNPAITPEPQVTLPVESQSQVVKTEQQMSLPARTESSMYVPVGTETSVPVSEPAKLQPGRKDPTAFTSGTAEPPATPLVRHEDGELVLAETNLPASIPTETQSATDTGNSQTIEVPDSDVTIQVYGDGTLVTSDKLGTNYSTINLDSLGLDKEMLKGDTNIELVIVQADGKEVRATIQTNFQGLQTAVQEKKKESNMETKKLESTVQTKTTDTGSTMNDVSLAKDVAKVARPYKCSKCPRTFKFEKTFKAHERVHEQAVVYTCTICSRAFAREENLKSHIDLHEKIAQATKWNSNQTDGLDIQEFKCKDCGKIFISPVNFSRHIQQMHSQDGCIPCPKCGKEFSSEYSFQTHMMKHKGPFLCPCCDQIFKKHEELVLHTQSWHSEDTFVCSVCNEIFRSKDLLALHMHDHHSQGVTKRLFDDKMHRCSECGRQFQKQQALTKHMMTHYPAAQCPYCSLKFKAKLSLAKHVAQVHNSNVINCDKCKMKFKRKDFYEMHVDEYHKGPYKCEKCGEIYQEKRELLSHRFSVHGLGVTCPICCAKFERKVDLMKHKEKEHRKPANVLCDVCGAGFVHKTQMKSHLVNEHFEGNKEHMLDVYPGMKNIAEPCEICKEILHTKVTCKIHYLNVHYDGNQEAMLKAHPFLKTYPNITEVLICDHCGKLFSQMSSLHKHLKHHGIDIPKSVKEKQTLQESKNSSEEESDVDLTNIKPRDAPKEYKCTIKKCRFSFARKAALVKHMKTHKVDYSLVAIRQMEIEDKERFEQKTRDGINPSPSKKAKTSELISKGNKVELADVGSKKLTCNKSAKAGSQNSSNVGSKKVKKTSIKSPKVRSSTLSNKTSIETAEIGLNKKDLVKRKPGRPRKIVTESELSVKEESSTPRKPGRPRKVVQEPVSLEKKKRGRPSKIKNVSGPATIGEPRKPGRPRKITESGTAESKLKVRRKRGRPLQIKTAKASKIIDKTIHHERRGRPTKIKRKLEDEESYRLVSKRPKLATKAPVKHCRSSNMQLKCKLCQKTFNKALSLMQHIRVVHREKRKKGRPRKLKKQENKSNDLKKDLSPGPVETVVMDIETFLGNHFSLGKKSIKDTRPEIENSQKNEMIDETVDPVKDSHEQLDNKATEDEVTDIHDLLEGYQVAKYPCRECGNMYGTSRGLIAHYKTNHADVDIETVNSEIAEIDKATVGTTAEMANICSSVNTDATLDEARIKQVEQKGIVAFHCQICLAEYSSSEEIYKHLEIFHPIIKDTRESQISSKAPDTLEGVNIKEEKGFLCTLCSKKFTEEINLSRHMKMKHFIGKKCGKGKDEIVTKRPPQGCGKEKNKNLKEAEFICSVCSKVFTEEANLGRHMKMKHYIGKKCNKGQSAVRQHNTISKGNKKNGLEVHECSHCTRKFKLESRLLLHLKVDHNMSKVNATMKEKANGGKVLKKLKCKHCNRQFSKQIHLNVHIIRKHRNKLSSKVPNDEVEKDCLCRSCNKTFSTIQSYRIHLRQKHINEMLTPSFKQGVKLINKEKSKAVHDKVGKGNDSDSNDESTSNISESEAKSISMPDTMENVEELQNTQDTESRKRNIIPSKQALGDVLNAGTSLKTTCVECFCCKDCKRLFWSDQKFKLHVKKVHPDTFALELDKKVIEQLNKAQTSTVTCAENVYQLLSPKSRNSFTGPMKQKCEFCSRVHWTKRSFDEHMLKYHLEEVQKNPEIYGLSLLPEKSQGSKSQKHISTKLSSDAVLVKFDEGTLVNFDQLAAAPVVLLEQLPLEKMVNFLKDDYMAADFEIKQECLSINDGNVNGIVDDDKIKIESPDSAKTETNSELLQQEPGNLISGIVSTKADVEVDSEVCKQENQEDIAQDSIENIENLDEEHKSKTGDFRTLKTYEDDGIVTVNLKTQEVSEFKPVLEGFSKNTSDEIIIKSDQNECQDVPPNAEMSSSGGTDVFNCSKSGAQQEEYKGVSLASEKEGTENSAEKEGNEKSSNEDTEMKKGAVLDQSLPANEDDEAELMPLKDVNDFICLEPEFKSSKQKELISVPVCPVKFDMETESQLITGQESFLKTEHNNEGSSDPTCDVENNGDDDCNTEVMSKSDSTDHSSDNMEMINKNIEVINKPASMFCDSNIKMIDQPAIMQDDSDCNIETSNKPDRALDYGNTQIVDEVDRTTGAIDANIEEMTEPNIALVDTDSNMEVINRPDLAMDDGEDKAEKHGTPIFEVQSDIVNSTDSDTCSDVHIDDNDHITHFQNSDSTADPTSVTFEDQSIEIAGNDNHVTEAPEQTSSLQNDQSNCNYVSR